MAKVNITTSCSDETVRHYFQPNQLGRNSLDSTEAYVEQNIECSKIVFSDSGRIYGFLNTPSEFKDVSELVYDGSHLFFKKRKVLFDASTFHRLAVSNDFSYCIGCTLKHSLFQRKSSLHITAFLFGKTMFENNEKDKRWKNTIHVNYRIKSMVHFGISPSYKYMIIIFYTDKKKLLCQWYHLVKMDLVSTECSYQVDLTTPFQKKLKETDLSEYEWSLQFSRDEECCLLFGFVFTFKSELLHTVNNQHTKGHFLITDSLNRDFVFTSNSAEVIKVYEVRDMGLSKIRDLQLTELGIDHVRDYKVQNILLLAQTRQNIYVIDPFSFVVLRTLNVYFEIDNILMNWSGEELLVYTVTRDSVIENCKVFYLNGSTSLKDLARRAVLSSFSYSQLKAVNVPKTLRSSLGI